MAPIHDTDVAEERWTKASWTSYELWEKVEVREKRKRHLWILATTVLFFVFSAIPVAIEQWPKWVTQHLAGKLSREITRMKKDASVARSAFRISFPDPSKLTYLIEKVSKCSDVRGELVTYGYLFKEPRLGEFSMISSTQGKDLEVPGLVNQFCFDPLKGSEMGEGNHEVAGFGIISVNDLTEKRLDRMSLLLVSGTSAEISFE